MSKLSAEGFEKIGAEIDKQCDIILFHLKEMTKNVNYLAKRYEKRKQKRKAKRSK